MSRFVDTDTLHPHPVMIIDSRNGKVKTEMVVFAREIDRAPTVEIFKRSKKTYVFYDEDWPKLCETHDKRQNGDA